MDSNSSFDISTPSISLGKSDKAFNFFMFIILIIILFIIIVPWNDLGLNSKKEGMSGGTLTQLFAQDSQDMYLTSNNMDAKTGNFNLFFNQPTRVANTFMNRGTPLPSIYLPDTSMNPTKDPIIASNNYTDYILNKSAKTCKNVDLNQNPNANANANVNANANPNKPKKSEKTFPNPLGTPESKDYLQLNKSEHQEDTSTEFVLPNVLASASASASASTSASSVSTIPNNVLPSSLPLDVLANSNPYELSSVAKQVAKKQSTSDNLPRLTEWTPEDILFQSYLNNAMYNKDCIKDPASCTLGTSGGARLPDGFVQSTKAVNSVNIDGTAFFPDSYVGSYYNDNFNGLNIMKPYAFMPNSNLPPNPVKMG